MAHALQITNLADFTHELSAKLPHAVDKLPILPDIRGKYLLDYHATRGQTLPVWEYGPLGLHQLSYPSALTAQEQALLAPLHPDDGPVLDLAASYGRVSAYLRGRGFQVTTADHSPGARLLYRLRGWKNVANLSPPDPVTGGPYAAIISFTNPLNCLPSDTKIAQALANLHDALDHNGQIIISVTFPKPPTIQPENPSPLAVLLYAQARSPWQKITLPDFDRLTTTLKKVGFEITHISPSHQDDPQRFYFHATKL